MTNGPIRGGGSWAAADAEDSRRTPKRTANTRRMRRKHSTGFGVRGSGFGVRGSGSMVLVPWFWFCGSVVPVLWLQSRRTKNQEPRNENPRTPNPRTRSVSPHPLLQVVDDDEARDVASAADELVARAARVTRCDGSRR